MNGFRGLDGVDWDGPIQAVTEVPHWVYKNMLLECASGCGLALFGKHVVKPSKNFADAGVLGCWYDACGTLERTGDCMPLSVFRIPTYIANRDFNLDVEPAAVCHATLPSVIARKLTWHGIKRDTFGHVAAKNCGCPAVFVQATGQVLIQHR